MPEAFLIGGARTPFAAWTRGRTAQGRRGGALAKLHPFDAGALAVKGALAKTEASPTRVDRIIFANMYHEGPHACYGARYVGLRAGLPESVPALSVAMACGSGLHAAIEAAQDIRMGESGLTVCGGADVVSRQPKDIFVPSFHDLACAQDIGATLEPLAAAQGIDRAAMDRWTLESQKRAAAAKEKHQEEIVAYGDLDFDDAIMGEAARQRIAEAKPVQGGAVTGANTHAIVDGASALVLAPRSAGALARIAGWGYVGVAPTDMAKASLPAIATALKGAGWQVADVDLWEINETFAGQLLLDVRELGLSEDRVNVNGGALAFGHPFAATGGRQLLALALELRRRGKSKGVASICIGGGLGVAVALETV
jgi:acetyl-CoA acyltransferase 2